MDQGHDIQELMEREGGGALEKFLQGIPVRFLQTIGGDNRSDGGSGNGNGGDGAHNDSFVCMGVPDDTHIERVLCDEVIKGNLLPGYSVFIGQQGVYGEGPFRETGAYFLAPDIVHGHIGRIVDKL